VGIAPRLRHVVQNVSGITTCQGELFPGAEPGPQFYPVSAIDYLTGYLMAFGVMVALARRAKEGGSWLVRISLAQTGRWLVDRGEVPEAALKDAPQEIPPADIERWSIDSDTPVGRLRHLRPTVRLSETSPTGPAPRSRSATTSPPGPPRRAVLSLHHPAGRSAIGLVFGADLSTIQKRVSYRAFNLARDGVIA
jgi:CoA-transferase family III